MSASATAQVSHNQIIKNLTAQVRDLEERQNGLINSVTKVLNNLSTQAGQLAEQLNAVVGIIGDDLVADVVLSERKTKLTEELEAARTQVAQGLADGKLLATTEVTEKSLILGVEKDSAGVPLHPGQAYLNFSILKDEFKTELLGKGVGYVVPKTPMGGTFEILGIFEVNPTPPVQAVPVETETVSANATAPEEVAAAAAAEPSDPTPQTETPSAAEAAGFSFDDDEPAAVGSTTNTVQ